MPFAEEELYAFWKNKRTKTKKPKTKKTKNISRCAAWILVEPQELIVGHHVMTVRNYTIMSLVS